MKIFVASVFVIAAACGSKQPSSEQPAAPSPAQPEQSFAEAMRTICDAPKDCGCMDEAPDIKAQSVANFVEGHVTNTEAKEWWTSLGSAASTEDKVTSLDQALAKAQIASADCVMRNVWTGIPPETP